MNDHTISIRGEVIAVSTLGWRDAVALARRLSTAIASVISKDGSFLLTPENLATSISESEGCVQFLIEKTTGRDTAWVESLTAREVLPLLQAIVERNFDREFVGSVKRIGGTLAEAFLPQVVAKK